MSTQTQGLIQGFGVLAQKRWMLLHVAGQEKTTGGVPLCTLSQGL